MIRQNQNIPRLFDAFSFLGQKVRDLLQRSWAEVFRRHILPKLPVQEFGQKYRKDFGRPSKNLHSMLGVLVLQQMHDTTDEETVQRLAFDTRWQYALDITGTTDEALYVCLKTLWKVRHQAIELRLEEKIFTLAGEGMIAAAGVGVERQRLDSLHVKSNMRRLGRLRLVGRTIQFFLKNLRRKEGGRWYRQVGEEQREKYMGGGGGEEIFSRVKPSETASTLGQAAQDLCALVEQFGGEEEVTRMASYRMMQRVLREQCRVVEEEEGERRVEVKAAKEVGGDTLQNPSDEGAGYSGHKGQGYTLQMMETFHGEEQRGPRLITYVEVTSAAITDHHAVIPALEKVKERGILPRQLVADTHYGSDENVQAAAREGVELVAPVANTEKSGVLSLSSFTLDEEGVVSRCPGGQAPFRARVVEKGVTVWFDPRGCAGCGHRESCPVKRSRKRVRLRYDKIAMRSSQRRQAEEGWAFREKYRMRSGIESSFSQLDRRTGVKQLRVRGSQAVRFCVFLKALGLNILRFTAWLAGGGLPRAIAANHSACGQFSERVPSLISSFLNPIRSFRGYGRWASAIKGLVPTLATELPSTLLFCCLCLVFIK